MVFPLNLLVLSQFLSCQPRHHPPNTLSQSLSPSLFSPQPPSIFIITVRLLSLPFFPYPSHSFTTTILSLIQLHISLPFPYESFTFLHLSLHLAYIFSLSLTHFISLVSSLFSSFFFHTITAFYFFRFFCICTSQSGGSSILFLHSTHYPIRSCSKMYIILVSWDSLSLSLWPENHREWRVLKSRGPARLVRCVSSLND